jgi:hypothetical protein
VEFLSAKNCGVFENELLIGAVVEKFASVREVTTSPLSGRPLPNRRVSKLLPRGRAPRSCSRWRTGWCRWPATSSVPTGVPL